MDVDQGPLPQTHHDRLLVVDRIVADLHRTYDLDLLAIGLYGSLAKGTGGPYSDVELFCVVDRPDLDFSHEWVYGPGKAEVNVYSPDLVRREARTLELDWSLAQGKFVHCRPLYGDLAFFEELRALVFSPPAAEFDALVHAMVVGELYEWIGKLRNGRARGEYAFLPSLACDFVRHTSLILGLVHRQLYSTGTALLPESLTLPDPPEGYTPLCRRVMAGDLADPSAVDAEVEALWAGLVPWLAHRGLSLDAAMPWPWEQP